MPAAIDSIRRQSYENIEIVISDNGSSDRTREVCEELCAADNRIVYHRFNENRGILVNRRKTWELSKGEFFVNASDDDYWHPHFSETLICPLIADPEASVAMGSVRLVGDDTIKIKQLGAGTCDRSELMSELITKLDSSGAKSKSNLFILGMIRSSHWYQLSLHERQYPSERYFLAVLGTLGRFVAVDDIVMDKRIQVKSFSARNLDDDFKRAARSRLSLLSFGVETLFNGKLPLKNKLTIVRPIAKVYYSIVRASMLERIPAPMRRVIRAAINMHR